MSATSVGASLSSADDSEHGAGGSSPEAEGSGSKKKQRRSAAEAFEYYGVFVAPFIIAGLGLLLFLYYQSLDLPNAKIQLRQTLDWDANLWPQLQRHLYLAFSATLAVVLIAIPLGVLLTRKAARRYSNGVLAVANGGQAFPAFGLLAVMLVFLGQGPTAVIVALVVYAVLPVLLNTMVGLDGVDESVIEAGRGMGMTRTQVLFRIELPLAVPVIIAGLRTAMIITIGTAALAYIIAGGGLGISISSGLKLQQDPVIFVSAALVALVALTFDWIGAIMERLLTPRGV